jgi:predicted NBD/HSP70 family sugar kinase
MIPKKSLHTNPVHSRFRVNTTRLLRDMNARQCLRVLRDKGSLSRAEIARELGTTKATVGNAIRELIDSGLVSAADQANDIAHVGRPGTNVRLDPEGAFFVGVEVEKKALTIQLFDFAMEVRATRDLRVNIERSPLNNFASKIAETALAVVGEADVPEEKIYGMGVSVPGIVSSASRVIIPSVPKWQGIDLKALLSAQLPNYWLLKICNNAAAVAFSLCEAFREADQQDFLFILLSEGVGSAVVRNGKVEKGYHGFAGEIGHLIMNARLSRRDESFERLTGYERFMPFLDARKTPAAALQDLAAQPNLTKELAAILADWADVLSVGLLNAIHMIDPGHIILGGPTAVLYPKVEERVLRTLRRSLLPGLKVPPIRLAGAALNEVTAGAAAYLRQELFRLPDFHAPGGFY